jgi:hypothetical protein
MLCGATLSAAAQTQEDPLPAFHGEYELLQDGDAKGRTTIDLKRDEGDVWELVTHSEGTSGLAGLAGADIEERSRFVWRDGRPELRSYRYAQKIAWKHKERSLDLLPDGARVDSRDGDKHRTIVFEAGAMDRHTVVLALARELRAGRHELSFRVADKGEMQTHRYRHAGHERVRVPAGEFDAIRVERIRDNPGRVTTTWFAAELGYMPVRIEQREPDGDVIEMRLSRTR